MKEYDMFWKNIEKERKEVDKERMKETKKEQELEKKTKKDNKSQMGKCEWDESFPQ